MNNIRNILSVLVNGVIKMSGEEVITLYQIDFDVLENKAENAIIIKKLGVFTKSKEKGLTAWGVCSEFIKQLPEMKHYLGWDDQVYPQFSIKK